MRGRRFEREIEKIQEQLSKYYPTLHLHQHTEGQWTVRGTFPVVTQEIEIDHYLIEIYIPSRFPREIPSIWEVGNRIPRIVDRHVFPNGRLCLFLPEERWRYWPENQDFIGLLQGAVNDYFLSQTYFAHYGSWPFGDRRHGVFGVFDYYMEELGTRDIDTIRSCLSYVVCNRAKGHWQCFCGSGKKLRNCHFEMFNHLRETLTPELAKLRLLELHKHREKLQNA